MRQAVHSGAIAVMFLNKLPHAGLAYWCYEQCCACCVGMRMLGRPFWQRHV